MSASTKKIVSRESDSSIKSRAILESRDIKGELHD